MHGSLLLALGLQCQCIAYDLLSGRNTRQDHLHAGVDRAAGHFGSAELVSRSRYKYPVTVVQVQNGGGWENRMMLPPLSAKYGSREHPDAHDAGVAQFDPHLGSAQARIENFADIGDAPVKNTIRKSI